ncbi:MAG: DUF6263 family protein [Verrucomicrobiia bacterium]
MNKNTLLVAVTLALSLSWVGCNKSGKLDDTSNFKTPGGPVELKLKWPLGERIVMNMDMKQKMETSMPGQPPTKIDMNMGQKYGLTVLKETPDGAHEVEMEYLSARMAMEMGGKKLLDYDSDKKLGSDKANPIGRPMADMFGKIIGAKIQYFMDASNEVERIEGVDELMSRLSSGGKMDPGAEMFKNSMFSKDQLKQLMSANRFMPPKPVKPGDTWPVKQSFEMGPLGTMVMDFDCTLQSWEMHGKRNCARIEFQGTAKSTPGTKANPTGMSMSILDGNFSGVSWFDPELGISIDMNMNQDMTMAMTIPMNGRGNAAARTQMMTNIMNQVLTMKLDSVK